MIRFQSAVSGDVILFDEPAAKLLAIMGFEGKRKGALMPADIPAAISKLEAAVAQPEARPDPNAVIDSEDRPWGKPPEPVVSLSQRAFPLIEMLRLAQARDKHVSWEG